MTATIKRPGRPAATKSRRLRFTSLETLGFTDVASSWSDSPVIDEETPRGRHLASPLRPEEIADWQPRDFGRRLTGSNIRWSLIIAFVFLAGALTALGYWLYQRPETIELTAQDELATRAETLQSAMPLLTEINQGLLLTEPGSIPASLDSVESMARKLFDISGSLTETRLRSAASQAAGSALDGVRLVRETYAYESAVLPLLDTPPLETDPELIALDEAARSFGDWQLGFDDVRTALPDRLLPSVTQQLDILSGDLTAFLGRYLDALRRDDTAAVENVLTSLKARLDTAAESLTNSVEDIQARVQVRISETDAALEKILSR